MTKRDDTGAMAEGQLDALPPEAEARLQALLVEQRAARAVEDGKRLAKRRLWHTHHWPEEYHRCAVIGGTHICRRCLALYPVAFMAMVLQLAGVSLWPEAFDPWLIWALCIPATAEFVAEKLAGLAYSARRQAITTLVVAPALGRGLAYELDDRWHWYFWGPVLVFGGGWFAAAVLAYQRQMMAAALASSTEFGSGAAGHESSP